MLYMCRLPRRFDDGISLWCGALFSVGSTAEIILDVDMCMEGDRDREGKVEAGNAVNHKKKL